MREVGTGCIKKTGRMVGREFGKLKEHDGGQYAMWEGGINRAHGMSTGYL